MFLRATTIGARSIPAACCKLPSAFPLLDCRPLRCRRYFPGLKSGGNRVTLAREEREAINAPIQGTAADIMKLAMIRVATALQKNNLNGRMLLQVHDELVLECPQNELKQTARIVRSMMENAYNLAIPLKTEARFGHNWGNLSILEE